MTRAAIDASVPLLEPPAWALAERQLFDLLDHAWRRFARDFTGPDGRLTYRHALTSRDGSACSRMNTSADTTGSTRARACSCCTS